MDISHREDDSPEGRRSRPRKRRSWFDGGSPKPSISYEIAVEKGKENAPIRSPEEIQFLILDHFTAQPKLDFGCVKVGQSKCCYLHVRNPRDYEQTVTIEKFPTQKGFSVESTEFSVDANDTMIIPIHWRPEEHGNCRQMVRFRVDDTYRLMAYFLGQCPQPQKPKKKRGGTIKGPAKAATDSRQQAPHARVAGKKTGSNQGSSSRAPLQTSNRNAAPKTSRSQSRPSSQLRPAGRKPTVARSASCNDRIIDGGIDAPADFDSRMTVRLSKPKVLNLEQLQQSGFQDGRKARGDVRVGRQPSQYAPAPAGETEEIVMVENTITETFTELVEVVREQIDVRTTELSERTTELSESHFTESHFTESRIDTDQYVADTNFESKVIEQEVVSIHETVVTKEVMYDDMEVISTHVKTLQENDDRFPVTTTRRMTFKKSDPELRHTPVVRASPTPPGVTSPPTYDDRFPRVPRRRVSLQKDDPSLPRTPVRRDTFHLRESRTPHTPVIASPSPRRAFFRARSASPRRDATPTVAFSDDTHAHLLKQPQNGLSQNKRMGTYTKLDSSLSPERVNGAERADLSNSFSDIDLPYCDETDTKSLAVRRDPKKLSVISERSTMSRDSLEGCDDLGQRFGPLWSWKKTQKNRRSVLSVDSLECTNTFLGEEDEDVLSVASTNSIYQTAQTSPCPSDSEAIADDFEDSVARLAHDDTAESNATVLENSALMSSLLQQKLQKVASFLEESGVVDENSREEKMSSEVLEKCGHLFVDKNRLLLSPTFNSSCEEGPGNDDISEASSAGGGSACKQTTSAENHPQLEKSCDKSSPVKSRLDPASLVQSRDVEECADSVNDDASDASSASDDMSLREFSERMKQVLPECSPNDSIERRPANDTRHFLKDNSEQSACKIFPGFQTDTAKEVDLELENEVRSKNSDAGSSCDSFASLIKSPTKLLPVPVFSVGRNSTVDKIKQDASPANDSFAELVEFSLKPLPPVPTFEESKPVSHKARKSVMFKADVKGSPAIRHEPQGGGKFRPSEVPQNPFDVTRTSTIGVHNPGFEDSIFADPASDDSLKPAPDSASKSSVLKLKSSITRHFVESLHPPERPSQIPPIPFDETTSSVIGIVNPGMEDSIFAEQSLRLKASQGDFSREFRIDKPAENVTYEKEDDKNVTFEKTTAKNITFEKENVSHNSCARKESPKMHGRCHNTTFDKETSSDSILSLLAKPVKPSGFQLQNELKGTEIGRHGNRPNNVGAVSGVDPVFGKVGGDWSTQDEPMTLDDLAMSPQAARPFQNPDRVSVEISQRLSSTPASAVSAPDDVSGSRATPTRPAPRAPFTPSPIGGSTYAFPHSVSRLAKSGNFDDEVFRAPGEVQTIPSPVINRPRDAFHAEGSRLLQRDGKAQRLETCPSKDLEAVAEEPWEGSGEGVPSPDSRRASNMTVTKSRPSMAEARLPVVGAPKRSLFHGAEPVTSQSALPPKQVEPPASGSVAMETAGPNRGNKIDSRALSEGSETIPDTVFYDISPPQKPRGKKICPKENVRQISPQKRDLSTETGPANRKRLRGEHLRHGTYPRANESERHVTRPEVAAAQHRQVPAKAAQTNFRVSRTTLLRKQAALGNLKTGAKGTQDSRAPGAKGRSVSASAVAPSGTRATAHPASRPVRAVPQRKLVLLKPAQKTALPKHPLAFAAKNIYYDERWMEKQDRGFTKWLNFVLTPADFHVQAKNTLKIDAGRLRALDQHDVSIAPTKEAVSLRAYSATRRLNRLRRDACALFTRDAFVAMTTKLEREINCGRMRIRSDRNVFADLGMKQNVLNMLLSYNPLWLRIGLEVVYGEVIGMNSAADALRLSSFILHRLLANPDISAEYAHPTVPHSYSHGYHEALGQFALKKFLLLVMFLDLSKTSRLIQEDPCLFCVDSQYKTSKDVLLSFSRDFLAGEGDLVKHLALLGYRVTHAQTALEEVDYGVTNLAVDLRDGLRLTRVVSLLSGTWSVTSSLRCPAISRLQKVHNVQVALNALLAQGASLDATRGGRIEARDVVDGHREKTLQLLWILILHFQVEQTLDEKRLKEEIAFLKKELRIKKKLAALDQDLDPEMLGLGRDRRESVQTLDLYASNEKLQLLLRWCKLICAHYDVKVENFTVSWSDGRALCYLVHHYHPGLLPSRAIQQQTTQTQCDQRADDSSADDSLTFSYSQPLSTSVTDIGAVEELLENEKKNFKLLYDAVCELGGVPMMVRCADMSATIPDEKVVITYVGCLCTRLLDLREESRAARVIQAAWREYAIARKLGHLQVRQKAAAVIQQCVRAFLNRRRAERRRVAAVRIQAHFRGHVARKLKARLMREKQLQEKISAAVTIQACIRGLLCRRRGEQEQHAAERIQGFYRACMARRRLEARRRAAVCIQQWWRGVRVARYEREQFRRVLTAVNHLQSHARLWLHRRHVRRQRAALTIQSELRMRVVRRRYLDLKGAAVVIQTFYRARRARRAYVQLRGAAVTVQSWLRSVRGRREFVKKKAAAVTIQANYRRLKAKQLFTRQKYAAVMIQKHYRAFSCRKKYACTKHAAVTIQSLYRGQKARRRFLRLAAAAVIIQSHYRGWNQRKEYVTMKHAAVIIQSQFRSWNDRKTFVQQKQAAVTIQAHYRRWKDRQIFVQKKCAAVTIQSYFRAAKEKETFQQLRRAAVTIQKNFRRLIIQRDLEKQTAAAVTIQSVCKRFVAEKQFRKKKQAAVTIQAHFRGSRGRRDFLKTKHAAVLLQSFFRRAKARRNYIRQKEAAVTIQSSYRCLRQRVAYLQLRAAAVCLQKQFRCVKVRRAYTEQRNAVVTVQAVYRGHRVRTEYLNQKQAAVTIQTWYRSCKARNAFERKRQAAVTLQSCFRGLRARRFLRTKTAAAVTIQRHYRGFQARRKYIDLKSAAVTIQSHYRRMRDRRKFLKQRSAAVTIQSYYRCFKARKEFVGIKSACVIIQSRFRGFRVRQKFLRQKRAAVTIQSWYRGAKARKNFLALKKVVMSCQKNYRCRRVRAEYLKFRDAAIIIQSFHRSSAARREFLQLKQAAVTVQKWYRAVARRNDFLKQKRAVATIEAFYKCFVERRSFVRQREAAVTVQKYYRRWSVQRSYRTHKNSAVTIQSWLRCWKDRREFLKIRRAAIHLQSCYRRWVKRRDYLQLTAAAVTIQTSWRCYKTKREFLRQKRAAIVIQTFVKSSKARKEFLRRKTAAVTIQSVYRGIRDRKQLRNKNKAAVSIQRFFRGSKVRKTFKRQKIAAVTVQSVLRCVKERRKFLRQKLAAVTIQSHLRCFYARKRYMAQLRAIVKVQSLYRMKVAKRDYCETVTAVRSIQSHFRCFQTRQQFLRQRRAAVTAQSYFRCVRARREFCEKRQAAVTIQAYFRAFRNRAHFMKLQKAAVTMQSNFRCAKARKEYVRQREAAITIQTCFKFSRERRRYLSLRAAAVTVQSQFRCWKMRKEFISVKQAAVTIQCNYRCYKQRQEYLKMRRAAVTVQSCYRRLRAVREIEEMRRACERELARQRAAVVIQKAYRGYRERRHFVRLRRCVVLLQRQMRRVVYRRHYSRVSSATRVIQHWWRRGRNARAQRECYVRKRDAARTVQRYARFFLYRRRYVRLRSAAVCLQRAWRARCQRVRTRRRLTAAVCIQRRYRAVRLARKERTHASTRRWAVLTLQRHAREFVARRRRQHAAATCIQRAWRGALARWRLARLTRAVLAIQRTFRHRRQYIQEKRRCVAAVKLQAVTRGYLARRTFLSYISAVVKLQALWRGRQTRRRVTDAKVARVRERIQTATENAVTQPTLRERTISALNFLLYMKHVDPLIEALVELDTLTQLLPHCCERLVEVDAVAVLYRLILACNRSEPHVRIITYALNTLLNVAMYGKTRPAVYLGEKDCVAVLVEMIFIHRFKKSPIFTRACTLLGIMSQHPPHKREILKMTGQLDKLQSIYNMVMRRNAKEDERLRTAARLAAVKTLNCTLPCARPPRLRLQMSPQWVLKKGARREELDHRQAITFVLQSLGLQ